MSDNILKFSMNRCTGVEQLDANTLRSVCRLRDTFTCASIEILASLPDLEIIEAHGQYHHQWQKTPSLDDILQKLRGVRIGSGMLKIIKGLIGKGDGEEDPRQITYMVEECCHGVILALTKDVLVKAPVSEEGKLEFFSNMVRDNVRLYNRCAAFAPGSRLVEGIDPPK